MLLSSLIKSLKISIKEWKYFLLLSMGIFINFYVFYLKENLQESYKILAYSLAFLYTIFMIISSFSLWGSVTRRTYELPLYSISENLKHSLFSALVFIVYVTVLGTLIHIFMLITNSIAIRSFLFLIFFALLISATLEILKVFFLDKEIFSLMDILVRVTTLKFWISYLLLISFITICYYFTDLFINYINIMMSYSTISITLTTIIRSIISGYLLISSIVFFITVFNLEEDSEINIVDGFIQS